MTVLVTAASEHGATAELAAWIGAGLAANGVDAEVRKLEEIDDLERYGAFVVGSAVYLGQWLKPARNFVDAHVGESRQQADMVVQYRADRRQPAAARRPERDAGWAGRATGRDDACTRPQAVRRQARQEQPELVREGRRALCACERGRLPRPRCGRRVGGDDRARAPAELTAVLRSAIPKPVQGSRTPSAWFRRRANDRVEAAIAPRADRTKSLDSGLYLVVAHALGGKECMRRREQGNPGRKVDDVALDPPP